MKLFCFHAVDVRLTYAETSPGNGLVLAAYGYSDDIHVIDPANLSGGSWTTIPNAKPWGEQEVYMTMAKPGLTMMMAIGFPEPVTTFISVKFDPVSQTFLKTVNTRGLTPMRSGCLIAMKKEYFKCTVL